MTENVTRQLVVPRKQRKKVLLIGHDTLLSGHQSINQSINQSKNVFHTLIIKYNIFKNNYVGKGKVEV